MDSGKANAVRVRWGWAIVAAVVGGGMSPSAVVAAPSAAVAEAGAGEKAASQSALNPTELRDRAMRVMETHCFSCHGPEKQEGEVRFDVLETIDPVDLARLFVESGQAVRVGDMPPEEAKSRPSKEERALLLQWLESQVSGEAAAALAEKLKRFEYGNVVDHGELFSGEHAKLPGYTSDRRWLVSEYIFNEKVNRLLDYHPSRTVYGKQVEVRGDSGIHWSPKTEQGNKFRRTITNPFLLPKKVGVRYQEALPGDAGADGCRVPAPRDSGGAGALPDDSCVYGAAAQGYLWRGE